MTRFDTIWESFPHFVSDLGNQKDPAIRIESPFHTLSPNGRYTFGIEIGIQ
jgi:hypothetical protein